MTPADLRTLLDRHQMHPDEMARLLAVNPRTVRHWLAGDRTIPGPVNQFFRLLKLTGHSARRILKLIG